jgi:cytidylate kinase
MRDERDATGPRGPAPDAVPVDTTGLSLEEVVAQLITLAVEAREIGVE